MDTTELNPIAGYHIVAMPYPGRGHINPMLNFCTLLASKDKDVMFTLVLTEEWLGLIGPLPDSPKNIRLRSIPNVIPSEHNRAANFLTFLEAVFRKMEAPFDRLLDQLERPASCIVADTILPWMMSVGRRRNIPVVSLCSLAPSMFSIGYHLDPVKVTGPLPDENLPERGQENKDSGPYILEAFSSVTKAQAILFTSFYDLQPHIIDSLRAELPMPIYTIGPSIPYLSLKVPPPNPISSSHQICFHWLDSQPESSVLYVSLGSFLSTSKAQLHELSAGLRASGVRFLWVARDEALSLQEACGEMGLIVPWCDQLRVLCHSSVGGFLTHCGWNSTTESIFAGVPMLTFPLAADQGHNCKLILDEWKVGLKFGQRLGTNNMVGREEVTRTVKRLMDLNGEEGKELRRRTKELQETCQRAIEIGGSTYSNFTAFIRDFVRGQCHTAM